jgi:inner membrane protein
MDTLTHALSGALLARATEPAAGSPARAGVLSRRARLWAGFWAAAFPDSDFVLRFVDPLFYLTNHRGVTHSFVMLPLWAVGLAALFALLSRGRYPWRAYVGVCALGIAIHILGDVITAFGTMVFAPLSTWRAQIPTTFIIDPLFTAIIVFGLVFSAVWSDTRRPSLIALAVLAGYVGFQGILHERAVAVGERARAALGLAAAEVEVHAIPQPFSPFNWMIVLADEREYRLSYVNLIAERVPEPPPPEASWLRRLLAAYRPVTALVWTRVPRHGDDPAQAALAEAAWEAPVFERYRRFALFPAVYRVDRSPARTCVWFQDLRFALAGRDMPFRYGTCRDGNPNEPWRVYRLLDDGHGREILDAIRIAG